jgi:hypothetical protein
VFLPLDRVRISSVRAQAGQPAVTGTVLEAGSTQRRATVRIDVSLVSRLQPGNKVTVTLPDGTTTPGVVSSVGTTVTKTAGGTNVVPVRIRPLHPAGLGRIDKEPVSVSVVTARARNVLAVPVNALLALLSGGYAVEVVDAAGAHRLLPVTLGLFDDSAGTVQITGAGLSAGQRVVVPAA